MIAKSHIFYIFIAFHLHASTAELDPTYRVDAMNDILTYRGWRLMAEYDTIAILVQRAGNAEKHVLHLRDLLKPDKYGQVVTYDNAEDKVRQAHQFLSCRYGHAINVCYDYGVGAARQCEKMDDPAEWLKCVRMFLGMIQKIDDLMSRLRGMFSCLYKVSPATTFVTSTSKAVENFQIFYDDLTSTFDADSLDKEYHKTIIGSAVDTMAVGMKSLRAFCGKFCLLASQEEEKNGISIAAGIVQTFEKSYPPVDVMYELEKGLRYIVNYFVRNYDRFPVGFEYDPLEKKTRIMYSP